MGVIAGLKVRPGEVDKWGWLPTSWSEWPLGVDGYDDDVWILLSSDSGLAHVFLSGERSYYDLEPVGARGETPQEG